MREEREREEREEREEKEKEREETEGRSGAMVSTRGREARTGLGGESDVDVTMAEEDATLDERKETTNSDKKEASKKKKTKSDQGGETSSNNMEKFKHLLEPIKNLAENWSVDIAVELEEYLEELEQISFEIPSVSSSSQQEGEGGEAATGSFSFAKAALVIQGSTYVYSKKVEYLYALVLDAIDKVMDASKTFFLF